MNNILKAEGDIDSGTNPKGEVRMDPAFEFVNTQRILKIKDHSERIGQHALICKDTQRANSVVP